MKTTSQTDLEINVDFLASWPGNWELSAEKCVINGKIQNFTRKCIRIGSSNRNLNELIENWII